MRFLHHVPLKRKLIIITMFTTTLALALACVAFTIYDQVVLRRDLVRDLSSTAEMIGFNSASALSFNDPASAEQTLKSLTAHGHIVAACIYGRDGAAFASYQRPGRKAEAAPIKAGASEATFGRDRLILVQGINFDGEVIGTVYLHSDLRELANRMKLSGIIFIIVMLGAGFTGYIIASRLQRVISDPVSHLAKVVGQVARDSNYSVRAVKQGNDEVGDLIDGFNEMLAQIHARDQKLQQAHDELEQRVEARTRELASSVSLLNATLDATADGIVAANHELNVVCYNKKLTAMWGLTPEMFSRNDTAAMVAFAAAQTRDPEAFTRRIMDSTKPGSLSADAVDVIELKDGRTFERYIHPQRIDGRNVGAVFSYRDITERRQAQEAVARERARFKFIFDSVPVGISLVVPGQADDSHIVNPAHTRITGIAPETLNVPGAFERATHPEDWHRQRTIVQQYKRGEIDHFTLEKRYVHADGKVVWAALTRRMFVDPSTGLKQSITTIIDISDLKAAEDEVARERARFKFIFEAVPVGISLVAPGEAASHLVNPAHARITGVAIADSREPGIFARVSHPDDFRRQMEFVEKYTAGEIDRFTVEKRYIHPDGKVVWAALTSRLFTEAATGRKQSVTTIVDITERKEAEAKLAETHQQLLDTSRQAGMAEVATGVLHNVGNVLNSVNVSTTLLAEIVRQSKIAHIAKLADLLTEKRADLGSFLTVDPRGQKVPAFLQTLATCLTQEQAGLLAEIESLRKNIEHIKEIVAMQQGYARVSGVSEMVRIGDLIEDALNMNAGAFARHEVAVVRDLQANPSATLEKHKVLQVLVNLLRNAKYACDESGRNDKQIVLRVTSTAERVRIAVIDNGVGIPAENLTRIFSHGFTTRKDGHGFGLHSGALAAKELGGTLTVESEGTGRGATFILELPLKQEAKAA
jgi:PAS domain S-box-containing protein